MNIDEIAFLKLGILTGEIEPLRAVFWADSRLSSDNNEYQFETLCELSVSKKDSRSVLSKLNEFDNRDIDLDIINL